MQTIHNPPDVWDYSNHKFDGTPRRVFDFINYLKRKFDALGYSSLFDIINNPIIVLPPAILANAPLFMPTDNMNARQIQVLKIQQDTYKSYKVNLDRDNEKAFKAMQVVVDHCDAHVLQKLADRRNEHIPNGRVKLIRFLEHILYVFSNNGKLQVIKREIQYEISTYLRDIDSFQKLRDAMESLTHKQNTLKLMNNYPPFHKLVADNQYIAPVVNDPVMIYEIPDNDLKFTLMHNLEQHANGDNTLVSFRQIVTSKPEYDTMTYSDLVNVLETLIISYTESRNKNEIKYDKQYKEFVQINDKVNLLMDNSNYNNRYQNSYNKYNNQNNNSKNYNNNYNDNIKRNTYK